MQLSCKTTVVAQGLSKSYFLTKTGSKRSIFKRNLLEVPALLPLDLAVNAGESVGVLGKNGSGKSTLLRLIAGTELPSDGKVLVSSTPTLLGVAAALDQSLPGRMNINLALMAMGVTAVEAKELAPGIIEWAELEDAIDRPLKTYSSGMLARLKFSIATSVPSEILLVDEALSTGDSTFAAKATDRMEKFINQSGTVFLVSHGPKTIKQHCTRALWLNQGRLIADDSAEIVVKFYRSWSTFMANKQADKAREVIEYASEYSAPKRVLLSSELAKTQTG